MKVDYLNFKEIFHSSFTEEEKRRRKSNMKVINQDFYQDLPSQLCSILDCFRWDYKDEPWFEEAWEKYRKHVLDAGLGGKIKMPGFVFNEYIDKYIEDKEKKLKKADYDILHYDCDMEELYHYGVKGQKWGIRRYQNEDGTYTAEGKARYGIDANGNMSKEGKALYKQDRKSALKDAKADLKSKKMINIWSGDQVTNKVRYEMAKQYINQNYGRQTLKDYQKDEAKKEVIASGVALLATAGLAAYAFHKLPK